MERNDNVAHTSYISLRSVKITAIVLAVIFTIIFGIRHYNNDPYFLQKSQVTIGNTTFITEIADTVEERTQGLSDRLSLPPYTGLFFIFDTEDTYSFWMKDMNFPIDIVWINAEFTVVDITYSISPDTFPASFRPKAPAQYVFEINAGEATYIKIGDKVHFQKISL